MLLIAAEFGYQYHYDDNWQSDQREHEENSKAHHGEVSPFVCYVFSINNLCKEMVKMGQRSLEDWSGSNCC